MYFYASFKTLSPKKFLLRWYFCIQNYNISLLSKENFLFLFDQDSYSQIKNMPVQIGADKRPHIGNYFKQILKQNSWTSHTSMCDS